MEVNSWGEYSSNYPADKNTLDEYRRKRGRELRGYRVASALNVLLLAAARGETVVYGKMNEAIHSTSRWEIEHVLNVVAKICVVNKWCILPSLLHKEGSDLPGGGFETTMNRLGITTVNVGSLRRECYSSKLPDSGDVMVQLSRWRMGLL